MNITYQHLGIAVGIFFAVSGLYFWMSQLLPMYDSFPYECQDSFFPAKLFCRHKENHEHTFSSSIPDETDIDTLFGS